MQSNYYSGEEKRIAQGEEEAKKRAMGALGAAQREREREKKSSGGKVGYLAWAFSAGKRRNDGSLPQRVAGRSAGPAKQ